MKQNKNIIKTLTALLAAVIVGEGVLGWGVYWIVILSLIEWGGVFWLGLALGIVVGVLNMVSVGFSGLFVLAVLTVAYLWQGKGGAARGWLVLVSVIANLMYDKVFGLPWNIGEMVVVLLVALFVFGRGSKEEDVKEQDR